MLNCSRDFHRYCWFFYVNIVMLINTRSKIHWTEETMSCGSFVVPKGLGSFSARLQSRVFGRKIVTLHNKTNSIFPYRAKWAMILVWARCRASWQLARTQFNKLRYGWPKRRSRPGSVKDRPDSESLKSALPNDFWIVISSWFYVEMLARRLAKS